MTGILLIVTTEILPIGLLTSVGSEFLITDGTAGLTMAVPGIVAAVAAPTVTATTARRDRRLMLCALVLLLAAANLLAAVAGAYWVLLVSRVMVGITIGGFWSIGVGIADRLVPAESVTRANAVIFSAVPLGSVLGVPAGTLLGDLVGWRAAFVVLGLLSLGTCAALAASLPRLPPVRPTRLRALGALLRGTGTRVGLLLTFLIVLAHFGAYTYVTPFLERVTRVDPSTVTVYLLAYGVAGILGNHVAGALIARSPRAAFAGAAALLGGATLLLPVLGDRPVGALVLLVAWGAAYGAVPICSQAWFAASAPGSPEAASVLFTASFQATICVGALGGGLVVDQTSPSAVMTLGGGTALLMVAVVGIHLALSAGPSAGPRPRGRR
ncbi:MFS transporter [Nocardiopsis sp. Huas11]|uniref:MFS transporter n=1 Tax=Nocardiopsis sp. Huas11 TaxID=2183912 RepID=UPI000EADF940|nr:MFS transporter [Nocardiopsis sp. Huas11]